MRTIEITISKNGQSTVETKGFVGSACRDASKFVEQALGQQSGEILKAEFHQAASSSQQLQQGQ